MTAGPTTELFLVDGRLKLVERGVGELDATVPAGIYKVKSRAGRREEERIVIVDRDHTLTLDYNPSFTSPVPLVGTAGTSESQVDAARRLSREVHVTAGSGSQILLFVRWSTAGARTQPAESAADVELYRWNGKLVGALDRTGARDPAGTDGGGFIGCTFAVDPGAYVLRRRAPSGVILEQAIIASPGWQTQVFVLKRSAEGRRSGDDRTPDPTALLVDDLSILMAREGFNPHSEEARLAELARLALADERRILSRELRGWLDGKFEDPMLGIVGGHLVDLSLRRAHDDEAARGKAAAGLQAPQPTLASESLPEDLNVVVDNLRRLVGDDHPDVEALSLCCPARSRRTGRPLSVAPMLRRSWSLYVAATNERRGLVRASLWRRVSEVTALVPYFAWQVRSSPQPERDPARHIARAVAEGERRRSRGATRAAPPPQSTAPTSTGAAPARARPIARAAIPVISATGPERDTADASAGERRPRVSPRLKREISISHDIPRAVLDRAFDEL
ncbi:MAG TPA: hypothetical protein VHK06_07955 [Candidatus Limnocylindria bacterium]|nr:hypothetical protein [Candidatus Limnocylindria bacterium]